MVDHLAGHILPPGASAQVDEDGGVDQDAAKHADEDPEIVKPKTLVLVDIINPALLAESVGK
jgi:hypothetical protein